MAFKLDDLIIDRIQQALATDFEDNPLYVLTQLTDATISTKAESTDAKDQTGTLIKRFWRAKTADFTATNAMLNMSVIGAASGETKQIASTTNKIVAPKIITVAGTATTATLTGLTAGGENSVTVMGLGTNGAKTNSYTKGATASATNFAVTTAGALTLPTGTSEDKFLIKYYRDITSGGMIRNRADKFPGTVKLTCRALAVDPCSADTVRGIYIVLPSFQVSPEIEVGLKTDTTINYAGQCQVNYCSDDKALYEIYWDEEETE